MSATAVARIPNFLQPQSCWQFPGKQYRLVGDVCVRLLPTGIFQNPGNINNRFWYARFNGFYEQSSVQLLEQIRIVPDTLLIVDAVGLSRFVNKVIFNLKQLTIKSGSFP